MDLVKEIKWRGLIKDVTDIELLEKLSQKKMTLYCGFDPTAASLHIGHLVPILMLKRFQNYGHRIIALVGGGTGLIGDPSFRKGERQMLTIEQGKENAEAIKQQLSQYLDFSDSSKTLLLNNYDWLHKISVIEFLSNYGTQFPVNYMLAKDTVASRLESGLSYTEFTYMILQSVDYHHLYTNYDCQLQIGGSDQWGNITSGVELIRRKEGVSVCGITLPLITKADGTKFGKSEGGALWIDKALTSPYTVYQYFLNTLDADVIDYLKVFTFLKQAEIEELGQSVVSEAHLRKAQKVLAYEIVKNMHSEVDAKEALQMSEILFGGDIRKLTLAQLKTCLEGVDNREVEASSELVEALITLKAATSKRDARELIQKGAIYVNGEKITDTYYQLTTQEAIDGQMFVVRKSKKNYYLLYLK